MEPLDHKFQQPEKHGEVKAEEQINVAREHQGENGDRAQKIDPKESVPMPELRKGSRGEIVMKAQRILKRSSDYVGYVDGDFGPFMEAAVQSFQRRSKVPITGIIDNDTWNALNQVH
ncbi:MAG: peptidoglycan-binding domain-containing protein [Nostocales cyanobacterium 94392]|nr:peptidoglycan-binding domain-containing protein [Nostocales cyanobacterium 94392]